MDTLCSVQVRCTRRSARPHNLRLRLPLAVPPHTRAARRAFDPRQRCRLPPSRLRLHTWPGAGCRRRSAGAGWGSCLGRAHPPPCRTRARSSAPCQTRRLLLRAQAAVHGTRQAARVGRLAAVMPQHRPRQGHLTCCLQLAEACVLAAGLGPAVHKHDRRCSKSAVEHRVVARVGLCLLVGRGGVLCESGAPRQHVARFAPTPTQAHAGTRRHTPTRHTAPHPPPSASPSSPARAARATPPAGRSSAQRAGSAAA
jgi:hypothetical protein